MKDFIKINIEHFVKFIKFIYERLLCIIISIAIVCLLTFLLFHFSDIKTPEDVECQQILVFGISLDNLGTWFTAVGLVITAVWSMHQYVKNTSIRQQEKASEIAQNFASNLIERMGLISEVLMQNQEVKKMITVIDDININQFTMLEAQRIFSDSKCFDKFINIIRSKNTQKRYEQVLNQNYNTKEKEKFDSQFTVLVDNTLNQLEAICINISSRAAGSQFIYESLHQMFLSTIEILYLRIAASNQNNVDKYYINIISVYNMWNIQKNKDINKLNKTNKKIQKLEEKMEKEITKLLNKQTKTV